MANKSRAVASWRCIAAVLTAATALASADERTRFSRARKHENAMRDAWCFDISKKNSPYVQSRGHRAAIADFEGACTEKTTCTD